MYISALEAMNPKTLLTMIRAVLLDERAVFDCDGELNAGARKFLLRLRHSAMFLEILSTSTVSLHKLEVLEQLGVSEQLKLFVTDDEAKIAELVTSEWCLPLESCLIVSVGRSLCSCNGAVQKIIPDSSGISVHLDSLLSFVANHNKKVQPEIVLVGHSMKWSRELDLLKRKALPMLPTQCGLAFVPIVLELPLEEQLLQVDIVLSKATDEIVSVSQASSPGDSFGGVVFSEGFKKLESFLSERSEIAVVDPIERVMPLVDRDATQLILRTLPSVNVSGGGTFRPPYSAKVHSFDEPGLMRRLRAESLVFPTIVKPQIACGASESHTMAVVFEENGFADLPVPLPAMIQEYVDHGSTIYKFYVIGESVFYSMRKSTPDAAVLRSKLSGDRPAVVFDSLKSLPTGDMDSSASNLDVEAMKTVGAFLRQKLGLTIVGFDIVVQAETHDHVIVDVNFFPTFKDISDQEALPAFWKALKTKQDMLEQEGLFARGK